LTGCWNGEKDIAPDKAFALSASALSGADSFGLDGEVSILDPDGVVADDSHFHGQVIGHGQLTLTWTRGSTIRTRSVEGPPAYRPLQLLGVVRKGNATVEYVRSSDQTVTLRIELDPDAAAKPFADGLRGEMAELRSGLKARKLKPAALQQSSRILDDADRELEAALSTLKVNTVILWTADRRTWFPMRMTEQSDLVYRWKGRTCRERRVSSASFLPAGQNGTIAEDSRMQSMMRRRTGRML
jgi:hypothetical protein